MPKNYSNAQLLAMAKDSKNETVFYPSTGLVTITTPTEELSVQLPCVNDAYDRWLNEEFNTYVAHPSPRPVVTAPDSRKESPLASGVLDYFPDALLAVARLSRLGNDKHNPGEPMHHARGKSSDHADALMRHLVDRGAVDTDTGLSHTVAVAWRALALLQEEIEKAGGLPLPRGAR